MTLKEFNELDKVAAAALLATTCGSSEWLQKVMAHFPFKNEEELVHVAGQVWYHECSRPDWIEAFSQHPKIGDIKSLSEKFPAIQHLSGTEQEGVNAAPAEVMEQLAFANDLYEAKFGFIFIVFATGKSAAEMLRILQDRSSNNYEEELVVAIGEQLKITIQRFKKVIEHADWHAIKISQLTTHVADTLLNAAGRNMTIRLKHFVNNNWCTLAQGVTNSDGKIDDLLPSGKNVLPGNYKMVFETSNYYKANNIAGFYPEIEIFFTVPDAAQYHVPLVLTADGYSTFTSK